MLISNVIKKCKERYDKKECKHCKDCSFGNYCPNNCEVCLDYLHFPAHVPDDAPKRKYDCVHMADFYTCKYSCRYTSELMYAIKKCSDICNIDELRVLSFGCGPCTDLFALDALKEKRELSFNDVQYHGVDYSKDVWVNIHHDIIEMKKEYMKVSFFYDDMCQYIDKLAQENWTSNLIIFQYVFSDMQKHTLTRNINYFIKKFAEYFNSKILPNSYIILNDINLSRRLDGGREYFDNLQEQLKNTKYHKNHFYNDNSANGGYTYGDTQPVNKNYFDLSDLSSFSPFNTCASAQMIIKKVK